LLSEDASLEPMLEPPEWPEAPECGLLLLEDEPLAPVSLEPLELPEPTAPEPLALPPVPVVLEPALPPPLGAAVAPVRLC
jgi:hypothetical protein